MKSSPIYAPLQILCSVSDSRPCAFSKRFIYSLPTLRFQRVSSCANQIPTGCVFFLLIFHSPLRTGSDETDGQEAGEDGHHKGGPEAAHPATGPAAAGPRGGQDPPAPHTR